MDIKDLKTTAWQMSIAGQGEVIEGVEDINQCLNIILTTQKNTDPLRMDFGVDILAWQDKPINVVAPALTKSIIEAIAEYEPRIDLRRVNYALKPEGRALFAVIWTYKDGMYYDGTLEKHSHTTYWLLSNENGFVLLDDYNVSIIIK